MSGVIFPDLFITKRVRKSEKRATKSTQFVRAARRPLQTFVMEKGVHHMRTGIDTALDSALMESPDDSILSVSSLSARPGEP